MKKNYHHRLGFTLVEMLVAIAVFSILIAVAIGGFVHALHTQREVAALIATQSNATLALEQMAREIRTGYLFCDVPGNNDPTSPEVSQPCEALTNGFGCTVIDVANDVWQCNDVLDFYNADDQEVNYTLDTGSIGRSEAGAAGPFTSITANNVSVTRLTFTIFGNTEGDNWPPRITISMGVAPNSTDPAIANDTVNLQTTISAREIDCDTDGSGAVSC